jgi:hypothetical protein
MGSMLAALVLATIPGYVLARKLEESRVLFPIVSLEPRLRFEKDRHLPASPPTLSSDVQGNLASFEQVLSSQEIVRYRFKRLHDRQTDIFARAQGFGVGRMGPTWFIRIEPIVISDVPVGRAVRIPELYRGWELLPHGDDEVAVVHEASRNDFTIPASLGWIMARGPSVAGFMPHAFHIPPLDRLERPISWTLDRLELVSLLKFDTPRVYVLDHLPRMDQLSGENSPTRPLDKFETAALERLRTKEDVVVEHTGDQYRMLGSLRAAKQCLDCHSVERGELLGAFSYVLHEKAR